MHEKTSGCVAVMGAMTQALRAQRVLANAAVPTEVIKTDADKRRGCAYALSYSCAQENNVRTLLASAGIRVREFLGERSW